MDILRVLNQPGWDYRLTCQGINIKAPSREAANQLAEKYGECLFETAVKIKGTVQVGWRHCTNPITFFSWMTSTPAETAEAILKTEGSVFSSQSYLPTPLLRRMILAGESDSPISIVRQTDKKQIIINEPMEVALRTPAVEATQRIMRSFFRDSDLQEIEMQFQTVSKFQWRYDAALNPHTWAILESEFERFEVNKQWYGQTTFLITPDLIPFPHDVVIQR